MGKKLKSFRCNSIQVIHLGETKKQKKIAKEKTATNTIRNYKLTSTSLDILVFFQKQANVQNLCEVHHLTKKVNISKIIDEFLRIISVNLEKKPAII